MKTSATALLSLLLIIGILISAGPAVSAQTESGSTLKVMTFNVWHGLRSGESNKRFPGEEPDRANKRFNWQIEEIKRLDPDVLLFQEVNKNQPQARRYAEALGYDEIHKVTSCGLHLGGLYKIPKNVNEGIAILAKPEFGLERVGKKRLSGNAMCSATWGFQTKESRYALFGSITVDGRVVLLTTTHLASPAFTPDGFDQQLDTLVDSGELTSDQRDEILAAGDRKLDRNTMEAQELVREIARQRDRLAAGGQKPVAILGGDFNAESDKPGFAKIKAAGFTEVASGPDFHTWNPVVNYENYSIGTKRYFALPTFGNPQVESMLDQRNTTPRQIDHLFISEGLEKVSAEMVMMQPKDGIYPSDHFGILASLRLRQ
jgi:endonuclease/exonuclease/phosphatase family metal-dependent hydrolase